MASNIVFSIIMPVWNHAAFIERAIKSVQMQTYQQYELLIIDDGSTDGVDALIESYCSDTIRYFYQSHTGVTSARNYGLKEAQGEFIAYLDADNVWHPRFLERMHEALRVHPERQTAYCQCNVFRKAPLTKKIEVHHVGGGAFNFKTLCRESSIDLNTFVHTKTCCENLGLFDKQLKRLTDWDFITRLTAIYTPVFVPEILVDYYDRISYNTITAREAFKPAYSTIKRRIKLMKRKAFLYHDTIRYDWDTISETKYQNWLKMRDIPMDFSTYASPGYPFFLEIEPTNTCNLSCTFCPVAQGVLNRPPRHMKLEEFKLLIDDMEPYLLFTVLWDWGEPFMNPQFPEMVRYVTERDIKSITSTNAHFLQNTDYLAEVYTAGLSTLIVAIDSVDDATYKLFRRQGSLDRALGGLKAAIDLKKKMNASTLINMRMVVTKNNEHEVRRLRQVARDLGADLFSIKTVNPSVCDSLENDKNIIPRAKKYRRYDYKPGTFERIKLSRHCKKIWSTSSVLSNGNVVACCYDYASQLKLGNILQQPFTQIWNGENYRIFRKELATQDHDHQRCLVCDINFQHSPTAWFYEFAFRRRLYKKLHHFARTTPLKKCYETYRRMRRRAGSQ